MCNDDSYNEIQIILFPIQIFKIKFKKSFQSNWLNKASKKNNKRTSRKITSGDEKNKNCIKNVIIDEGNDKGENIIKEVNEKGRLNNRLNGDTRKRKFKKIIIEKARKNN